MLAGLQKVGPRISGIERALQHIAESVEPLRGAKSIVLLGYGFGRFDGHSGGITLMDGWDEANAALQRARVSVFTLNVTQANYNSLQAGLQTVSAETGGIYASTYEFPRLAIRRVGQALAGHYVLFVEKPNLDRGIHSIQVKLTRTEGTVTAKHVCRGIISRRERSVWSRAAASLSRDTPPRFSPTVCCTSQAP